VTDAELKSHAQHAGCASAYAIKAAAVNTGEKVCTFIDQKTMYGGKHLVPGDTVFLFESENEGGRGLVARGVVARAQATPRKLGVERQTPRVSVELALNGLAQRPLGRTQLRLFNAWDDGQPQTELNFKLYRQGTNKIVGLSASTAAFLNGYFAAWRSSRG
jgi:hypothetical protein